MFSIIEILYIIFSLISSLSSLMVTLAFHKMGIEKRKSGVKIGFILYCKILFLSISIIHLLAMSAMTIAPRLLADKPVFYYILATRSCTVLGLTFLYTIEIAAILALLVLWTKMVRASLVMEITFSSQFIQRSLNYAGLIERYGKSICITGIIGIWILTLGASFSVAPDYIRSFPISILISIPLAMGCSLLLAPVAYATFTIVHALSKSKDFGPKFKVAKLYVFGYMSTLMAIWAPVLITFIYPNFYQDLSITRQPQDEFYTRPYQEDRDNLFAPILFPSCFGGLFVSFSVSKFLKSNLGKAPETVDTTVKPVITISVSKSTANDQVDTLSKNSRNDKRSFNEID